jgi:hypothetical protein
MTKILALLVAAMLTACGGGEPDPFCADPNGPPPIAAGDLTPDQVRAIWDRWMAECR